MEHQVILLPRENYWTWVRACTEYVLHYGPNLTQDPQTAAQYMSPAQVITFPAFSGGYPENGQLEEWFFKQHPGVRLDPISTETAEGLRDEFAQRIIDSDRYGQKRKSFYLVWPTDYSVITQKYGANPQIYSRFGMPGHEGVDIRALNNTNIYCCADGVVYRVHNDPDPRVSAYGKHVRVRHKDGYKTVYGHLARPLVREGQELKAGELLGKADSTGASTGSHLHLTLKRDGATDRGETNFPKDIIDPTPFLVWPEFASKKSFDAYNWSPEKCLVGAHARVGQPLQEEDLNLISLARLEAIKLELNESLDTIERLRALAPEMFIVVRTTGDFSGEAISAESYFTSIENNFGRLYRSGIKYFEILSNPNLQNAGWRRSWRDGLEFAQWFNKLSHLIKERFPDAKVGFPGLSQGELVPGWRADDAQFLNEAESAVQNADWVGLNCYWTDQASLKERKKGRAFEVYRDRFPGKLLMITEFCNPIQSIDERTKADQYAEFYRMVRYQPGIAAAFAYALSAVRDHDAIVWRSEISDGTKLAGLIGNRSI
jgi:murein DD-endopeptidase MepM/ murein hydrolase activator NlpD